MKITQKISTIRNLAKPFFKEYAGTVLVVALMCDIISLVPGMIINVFWPTSELALTISELYSILISGPLLFSEAILFLSAFRNQCAGMNSIVYGFHNSPKVIQLSLSIYFRVLIGFILFIIPGFYMALKYSLAYYVLADHPEYTAGQCLRESARLTTGNKWKYIKLGLSYLPLMLVCSLPRCILAYYTMEMPLIADERSIAIAYANSFASPICVLLGVLVVYAQCKFEMAQACFYDIAAEKLIFDTTLSDAEEECEIVEA